MPAPLGSPIFQWFTDAGLPANGYKVYTYAAGTSTPLATYPTSADASAGTNALANPVVLDSAGRAAIWLADAFYKVVIKTDADVTVYTIDYVDGSTSGGGGSATTTQWVPFTSGNPTYISANSFSLAGDQTASFPIGTKIKSTNTGGTTYSYVTASAFSSVTTVTVANSSGTLDAGLSAVSTGIITTVNSSFPAFTDLTVLGEVGATAVTGTAVALRFSTTVYGDRLSEITTGSSGNFTPKVTGAYEFIGTGVITTAAGTTGISGLTQYIQLYVNGVEAPVTILGQVSWPYADSNLRHFTIPAVGAASLTAGDVVTFRMKTTFTGTAPDISFGMMSIRRRLT